MNNFFAAVGKRTSEEKILLAMLVMLSLAVIYLGSSLLSINREFIAKKNHVEKLETELAKLRDFNRKVVRSNHSMAKSLNNLSRSYRELRKKIAEPGRGVEDYLAFNDTKNPELGQ